METWHLDFVRSKLCATKYIGTDTVTVADFVLLCYFFKQKTSYDIRISDWSSDVCSSDLPPSSTLPRGDMRAEPGATMPPIGRRSFSSPPVPCSSRTGGLPGEAAGSKRWTKDRDVVVMG